MKAVTHLLEEFQWARQLLEVVTADLTPEQAHWRPPGIANPIGAIYAHAVAGADGVVNRLLKGKLPFFAGEWRGKTGASDPVWQLELERGRALQIDLPAFREYTSAVFASVEDYIRSLTDEDLDREIDLTNAGMGQRTVGWALGALLIGHINNMSGEISCLKGLQGTKGYPF
jgi:hypothetical protein